LHAYDQAIAAAAGQGLVHNEAIACELAARFHRACGRAAIADHFLREARGAYLRWGAEGKVRQLEALYPQLRERGPSPAAATLASGADQIDLLSVTKALQAISGEIVLEKLLVRLVEVVLAQAGASKGYLLLRDGDALTIEAEAHTDEGGQLVVNLLRALPAAGSALLPEGIVNYVLRTRDKVLLENASASPRFAGDDYVLRARPKSILCLPILRQAELVGLLYLENDLVTGAFRQDQLAVLEVLAGQAAISLEHAVLLAKEQAARLQTLEALRSREEFLTVISHELRTPLTSLTWTLQTLQGEAGPTPQPVAAESSTQLMNLAVRQVRRMNRLVGELLEASRAQSGRLSLELARFDLAKLAAEVIERWRPDLERARCALSVVVAPPVIGLWDAERLDQVMENLLSNAIKFGTGQPIEVSLEENDGVACLAVKDRGIGIDPSKLPRLFERFGRGVSEENYGGIGLGLYISRRIVEAHGGTISVVSHVGAGSTFTVRLPCGGPAGPEAALTVH
jgi:signal transduction histidine kinase